MITTIWPPVPSSLVKPVPVKDSEPPAATERAPAATAAPSGLSGGRGGAAITALAPSRTAPVASAVIVARRIANAA